MDLDDADRAILAAQFDWTGSTMSALAQRIVERAQALSGDGAQAQAVFESRGIL